MTTMKHLREELEALLWKRLAPVITDRREGATVVRDVMKAADAYAKAGQPRSAAKPRGPKKPPAVHYAAASGAAACKPGDWGTRRWQLTMDPQAVTCESCRKSPAWQEAGEPS